MRDQFFIALDLLRMLPRMVMSSVAEQTIAGLARIVQEVPDALRTTTEWNMAFSVLGTASARDEAARSAFDFLARLANDKIGGGIRAENFVGYVEVLNTFATAAAAKEQKDPSEQSRLVSGTREICQLR